MDDILSEQAMKIILFAGDARVNCKNALVATEKNDFETAAEEMKVAKTNITEAHKIQTQAIQSEMGEETKQHEHSLLFTHAQDTLMTIYSEINMANHLIKIAKQLNDRLTILEKN
ncbi:PTS lactose/cellobiose transporter subunit IIA [Enterococcus ureasiticus]|uniref:PTS lactose transporter subunit IIA n=1 Tax=Enterococcus ureasiticus TaxID=903984 RepID=A0A1E5GNT1_9ENTE|nr:PTS lactose/cellobiose transporter subunit IIA [Enterococcus ureasiticus]OEG14357.1 PTS lactose transporter subunit IIA [Enterococcus ureasiticus]